MQIINNDPSQLQDCLEKIDFVDNGPQGESKFTTSFSIIKDTNTKPLIELYDQTMGVKVTRRGKENLNKRAMKRNDVFATNEH